MLRTATALGFVLATLAAGCAGCSKSGTKDTPEEPPGKIEAPPGLGSERGTTEGTVVGGDKGTKAPVADPAMRLAPEEGKIAIELPADAKPGAETIAKVVVTPASAYYVNTEYPTKLTLQAPPDGVTLAKGELKAGGPSQAKGDADVFAKDNLVFSVKLTPAQSGSYTINGSFKFAVCDKAGSTCLPKKEPVSIEVAAK